MNFKEAVESCLSKYAVFTGRARRCEYWYFVLFNAIVNAVISLIGAVVGESIYTALSALVGLVLLMPNIGVSIRRMHDIGKSGWTLLFGLIPIVGWILLIVWECKDSEPGANQYGPNPKEGDVGAAF